MEREWTSTPGPVAVENGESTNTVIKVDHDGCTNTIKLGDSKMLFKAKGLLLEDKDMKIELGLVAENMAMDKASRYKGQLNVEGAELGGAKLNMRVSIRLIANIENFWA